MAFNIPAQTSFSPLKPTTTTTPWVRPADWITITDAPNIVQFLVSDIVYPAYNIQTTFTQTGGVGNIYIDWGDGTSTTVSTTTATNNEKTYTSGGTYSSEGYNTWKITISGDSGTRITSATFFNPSYWGSAVQQPTGLLEEYYGDGTITNPTNLHTTGTTKPFFYNLVYSKLPSIMTGSTSLLSAYYTCGNMRTVVLPTSMPGLGSMANAFDSCLALTNVVLPQDATGITSMASSFLSCYGLTGVTLPPSLNSVTSMVSAFQNCFSLGNIILPSTLACTNYTSAFQACYNLLNFDFNNFGTGATVNLATMFSNCWSLEYIKFPTSISNPSTVYTPGNMFNTCRSLKSCIFPTNMNMSDMSTTFQSCLSLSYVALPTSASSLTTISGTFNGCTNLSSVVLPTVVGASINMNQTFTNCSTLASMSIPSGWTLTDMALTFNNCFNLVSVSLPTGAQNSITSLASTFANCYNLRSVTLPSSMTSVTSLLGTFQNCYQLTGVTYPSTLNSVTTMSTLHANNYSLQRVTLPTSAPLCNSLSGIFNTCWKLSGATLPATVSSSLTTFANAFLNCYSIRSITLPSTQMTAVNAGGGNNIFQNCYSLTGITNVDKIGTTSTTTGATTQYTNVLVNTYELNQSLSFSNTMSIFQANGTSTRSTKLSGLRFLNTRGSGFQWGGASPQIDISYTSLSTAALNTLFADIAAQGNVTSKTINITGASGAAGLTAADRLVLTSRGWTITG